MTVEKDSAEKNKELWYVSSKWFRVARKIRERKETAARSTCSITGGVFLIRRRDANAVTLKQKIR
jgi:hypothetical protein